MATSQNGWPVDRTGDQQDRAALYPGVTAPNGIRHGDVAVVLRYVARRFHQEVEALHPGWCWGWHVKTIEGGSSISNHASGTAIDLNAPDHPMGKRNTFTASQRAAIERILADCAGVVRWGGHYTGRADDMHFEIDRGPEVVASLAARIKRGSERTMQDLQGYALPVLRQGDDDAAADGYNTVTRAQRMLDWLADGHTVEPDGVYGPQTAAAVKALGFGDGKVIDRPVWAKLYGLTRTGP